MAATPSTSDVTFVNSTFSCAEGRRGLDRRLRREVRLDVVVQLTLRDRFLLREGRVPLDVAGGPAQLRLGLCELRLCLGQDGIEWTSIDLEKDLAFSDDCAFAIIPLQ
jgi:hypothetical protein